MSRDMAGKLSPDLLRKYVYPRVGISDPRVIVGPGYGEDAAVIDLGEESLVIHVDPITGAIEWLGWLAVHIVSNDIAVSGARPRWLLPVLYLHERTGEDVIDRLTGQIDEAARELEEMVVGGHSEFTRGLDRPLISMTAVGTVARGRYVRTSGAKPGDVILMTKTAGIEGTAILATDFKELAEDEGVDGGLLKRAAEFIRRVSVVHEALAAIGEGVTAMHDPTEGGIAGGLAEIAYSSDVMIEVWEDRVPVAEETRILCEAFEIDPLKLMSSGALLAAVPRDRIEGVLASIKEAGSEATVIGEVEDGRGLLMHKKDEDEFLGECVEEELYRLWRIRNRGGPAGPSPEGCRPRGKDI